MGSAWSHGSTAWSHTRRSCPRGSGFEVLAYAALDEAEARSAPSRTACSSGLGFSHVPEFLSVW